MVILFLFPCSRKRAGARGALDHGQASNVLAVSDDLDNLEMSYLL